MSPEPEVEQVSLRQRFLRPRTLVSFLIAIAIIVFMLTQFQIDLEKTWQSIASANLLLVLLAFLVYYASFPIRGLRWRILLRNAGTEGRLGVWDLTEIVYLSWFANCIVPAKLGDVYRGYLLKTSEGVTLSKTLGTILAERILDLLVLIVMMCAAGWWAFQGRLPDEVLFAFQFGLVLAALAVAGLVGMRFFGSVVRRFIPARFCDVYIRFEEGVLLSFKRLPTLVGLTLITWFSEVGRVYFVVLALGLQLDFGLVTFIALLEAVLTTLPITPAGLGFTEAGIIGVLIFAVPGMTREMASAVAAIDRLISYVSLVFFGLILFLVSKKTK
ncbi:MAG: flippase-like domain-containing protein [Chloroflexi bacterium]|nr:flippase-like domain-containing protein [Chloroflexota bacterium]MBU1746861.1 flippase-like domain-containing protein [Chloroflexota bacterium]MBU1879596.1 flippase-like domain-containing protein [Chloroflexota bacterium]